MCLADWHTCWLQGWSNLAPWHRTLFTGFPMRVCPAERGGLQPGPEPSAVFNYDHNQCGTWVSRKLFGCGRKGSVVEMSPATRLPLSPGRSPWPSQQPHQQCRDSCLGQRCLSCLAYGFGVIIKSSVSVPVLCRNAMEDAWLWGTVWHRRPSSLGLLGMEAVCGPPSTSSILKAGFLVALVSDLGNQSANAVCPLTAFLSQQGGGIVGMRLCKGRGWRRKHRLCVHVCVAVQARTSCPRFIYSAKYKSTWKMFEVIWMLN